MSGRLEGRAALVTGSTSGIGKAICERFAAEGCRVLVTGLSKEAGKEVADGIQRRGGTAAFFLADLAVDAEVEALVQFAVKSLGRMDIVVNNAGIVPRNADGSMSDGPIHRTDPEYWDRLWAVDLRAIFMMCKLSVPHLLSSRNACIINIASIHGVHGCGMDAYSAIKSGVIGLSRSMAVSYRHRIRVNCISPGMVVVERTAPLWEQHPEMHEQARETLLTRVGRPADVAELCTFLASNEGEYASGANFTLDGGASVRGAFPPGPQSMRSWFEVGDEPGQ